nr:hypothetical protein [Georgenia yuyongxinii]
MAQINVLLCAAASSTGGIHRGGRPVTTTAWMPACVYAVSAARLRSETLLPRGTMVTSIPVATSRLASVTKLLWARQCTPQADY